MARRVKAGPRPADDGLDLDAARIFVRIPAYRDPETLPTLERLFERAERPERITVGVCWQYGPDEGPLPVPIRYAGRVRVVDVPAEESRGPAWARHRAEGLLRDEDFVLGVDAHTQPAIGWDAALLDTWRRAGPRAVLSAPPAGYKAPDLLRSNPLPGYRRPHRVDRRGLLELRTGFFDGFPEAPVRGAFVVSRFVFAPAEAIRAVPCDPGLYLDEEDLTLSVRLFTHGWDVYAPADVFMWHLYNDDGEQRPLHWKAYDDWRSLRAEARRRARRLLGIEPLKAHEQPDPDDRYRLGTARTLDDFAAFCGFDVRAGRPTPAADRCPWVEALREVASIDGYWIAPPDPPPAPAPPPPLAPGDCAPYVTLPLPSGKRGELHLYAGAPLALFFVPADAPAADPFVTLLAARSEHFEVAGTRAVIVGVGPGAKRLSRPGAPPVWLDADGAVARAFGAEGERAILLDRNLRVVDVAVGLSQGVIGRMVDGGRALRDTHDRAPRTIAPHPPVLVVPDAIDDDLRMALIDAWRAGDHFQGRTGSGQGSKVRLNRKVRTDVQVDKALRARIDAALVGRLAPEIEKVFGFRPTRRETYKVGCYPADGGGFFGQHRDNFEPALAHRRVAMTLNLNADFEGGRLVFPEYGPDGYAPTPGTAVVFPCALMHRVDPVTAGLRFTLVSFFHDEAGARLRRQMRRTAGLPPPKDDRRFIAPRRGVVSHHEDIRHRYAMLRDPEHPPAPQRPVTLVEARGAGNPEVARRRTDTPPGVLVVDDYLHPDACERITRYTLDAPGRPLRVLDHDRSDGDTLVMRTSDKRITEKVRIDGIAPEMLALFTDVYGHRLEPFYGVEFEWFERPQILRYGPGGKYHAHADAEHYDREAKRFVRAQDRDYSVLVYVNDGYEGGAIAFPRLDYEVRPEPGMLVAFPSDHRFEHAARPTTAGTRIALVSWGAVRGTPRVRPRPPYGAVIFRPR